MGAKPRTGDWDAVGTAVGFWGVPTFWSFFGGSRLATDALAMPPLRSGDEVGSGLLAGADVGFGGVASLGSSRGMLREMSGRVSG